MQAGANMRFCMQRLHKSFRINHQNAELIRYIGNRVSRSAVARINPSPRFSRYSRALAPGAEAISGPVAHTTPLMLKFG